MSILAAFPAAAFVLGSWQLYRLQWKLGLIAETDAALARAPVPLSLDALPAEFIKVSLDGTLEPAPEFLVGPRVRDGEPGFHAIAPMTMDDGRRVLVNRGWIARDRKEDVTRHAPTAARQSITGLVKRNAERPAWAHDNKPEKGEWYWSDVATMAAMANAQPIYVEAVDTLSPNDEQTYRERGLPIAKPPSANLKNDHLQYAITWYTLSAATTAMLFLRRRSGAGSAGMRIGRRTHLG
ncbi:SURF1 family-domain-containing protein [Blastocladiella britannica]|nr:SURF1 family-domain-containing protein [Blastocladiella britannica]